MFVDVIKASADIYRDNTTFIPAVLSLETGHLLSDRNVDDKEIADLMELKRDLGNFVSTYIQKKKLAGVHTAWWFQEYVVCSDCVKNDLFWYASPSAYLCREHLTALRLQNKLCGIRALHAPVMRIAE